MNAYVALGGNLGDVAATFCAALERLSAFGTVTARSHLYRTAPWGNIHQPDFLNAVVALETDLAPNMLLEKLLETERALGRERRERWGPRTLDLDLLDYGGITLESETLTLPHPRILERAFVLVPLLELDPDWRDPASGRRGQDALEGLDAGGVVRVGELG